MEEKKGNMEIGDRRVEQKEHLEEEGDRRVTMHSEREAESRLVKLCQRVFMPPVQPEVIDCKPTAYVMFKHEIKAMWEGAELDDREKLRLLYRYTREEVRVSAGVSV